MSVRVKHIAQSLSKEWLQDTFSHCGTVQRIELTVAVGKTYNSAVVHFSTLEEAQAAVRELNGSEIDGSVMQVVLHNDSKSSNPRTASLRDEPRQVSPGPVLGSLKFGQEIKHDSTTKSIFQAPPVVGLKVQTDKRTSSATDFSLNLDKPKDVPISSHSESQGKQSAPSTFSFALPDDRLPKITSSKSDPQPQLSLASLSKAAPAKKVVKRSSSAFVSDRPRSHSVSPTPKQMHTTYKSTSVSPTPKQTKQHRHHPYPKPSQPIPTLQGGKHKRVTQQQTLPSENPFLKGLKQEKKTSTSVPPPPKVATVSRDQPSKDFRARQTKSIPLSENLVCKLLDTHPRIAAELASLSAESGVMYSVVDDNTSLLTLTGFQIDVEKAEKGLATLVDTVQKNITNEYVPLHCMFIPLLATAEAIGMLEHIANKHCVQIAISLPNSGVLSFKDFASEYNKRDPTVLLQTSELQQLTVSNPPLEPQPAVWSYFVGGITVQHGTNDSESIDHVFRYGGQHLKLSYNNLYHTFDFYSTVMSQVDLKTGERLHLLRVPAAVPNHDGSWTPEYVLMVTVRGIPECITAAKEEIELMLQAAVREQEVPCGLPPGVSQQPQKVQEFLFLMLNYARQYCIRLKPIDFERISIKFESTSDYGEKVKLELQKHSLELQREILHAIAQTCTQVVPQTVHPTFTQPNIDTTTVPEQWEVQCFNSELKDVSSDSLEWKQVLAEMLPTMSHVKLKRLQRIQNEPLWAKYALEKSQMYGRNSGEINERGLFHGTRNTDPVEVVQSEKGIDFRFSSQESRLLWGKGSYFAVNASYSNRYCYKCSNGDKQMLLVRVLTGKSFQSGEEHHSEYTKPPLLNPVSNKRYDTVTGRTGGSQVYVVYDHDKSYPAYLITYQ